MRTTPTIGIIIVIVQHRDETLQVVLVGPRMVDTMMNLIQHPSGMKHKLQIHPNRIQSRDLMVNSYHNHHESRQDLPLNSVDSMFCPVLVV